MLSFIHVDLLPSYYHTEVIQLGMQPKSKDHFRIPPTPLSSQIPLSHHFVFGQFGPTEPCFLISYPLEMYVSCFDLSCHQLALTSQSEYVQAGLVCTLTSIILTLTQTPRNIPKHLMRSRIGRALF
jgi:hypothetical protein